MSDDETIDNTEELDIIENKPDLHHFYHVYSKGAWQMPMTEHIAALRHSGLINNLKTFQVGLVGPEDTRNAVREYLDSEGIEYIVCAEADDGWEQETQDALHDFAQENDGYIYYAHTKNAVAINAHHIIWRLSMTYHTAIIWEDVIKKLDEGFSAVGSHYINGATHPDDSNIKRDHGFFGGTFWWTHLKYIKQFPNKPKRLNRYEAEVWIWLLKDVVESNGEEFRIYDYVPTHPVDTGRMVSSW